MLVLELNINPKNKHMFHDKYGSKKGTENSIMFTTHQIFFHVSIYVHAYIF